MRVTASSVFDQVSTFGGVKSPVNGLDKLRLPLQHAGDGFLNYLRSHFALAGRELA